MGSWTKMEMNKNITKTNNDFFDAHGYYIVKNLYDPKKLSCKVPLVRGQLHYYGSLTKVSHIPEEAQVSGSISRYSYPPYKESHSDIRIKLENIVGKQLLNTYYYDRFYFPGQELKPHTDRDACEISVSINISSNLKQPWAFQLTTLQGENKKIFLNPGDGLLYKGCEVTHWRDSMSGIKRNYIRNFLHLPELYYHQIFYHYVLADGHRVHCAFDAAK